VEIPHAIRTEHELAAVCAALGAETISGLTELEKRLLAACGGAPSAAVVRSVTTAMAAGEDPLGDVFCRLRSPEQRRPSGATYTPATIVCSMLQWAQNHGRPRRVVDAGAGSARFLVASSRIWIDAELIAVELDPLAALMARASLAAHGLADRATVLMSDYRSLSLPERRDQGSTLFIGNPPYVRHHQIDPAWKEWLTRTARNHGLAASQLAGLHVHFYLATLQHARVGDFGTFITAAEWLDVNYGSMLRELFLGELGGLALHIVDPKALPFADAATTAAITCFEIGARPRSVYIRRINSLQKLGTLDGGRRVRRERLESANRWSALVYGPRDVPEGFIELGELCRVRRGQVTGANDFWIAADENGSLPASVFYPTVTRARELYTAGLALRDTTVLRRVIDLPEDLDIFVGEAKKAIAALLSKAKRAGVDRGYVAQNRRAWWRVGLHDPAPILATYMARRPPGFVRNLGQARHINIAHGLYPRECLSDAVLDALAAYLSKNVSLREGRTYAGGLVKFEPKEMERLIVPSPRFLAIST
jgi:adenine-specific DNA-methyltransferase